MAKESDPKLALAAVQLGLKLERLAFSSIRQIQSQADNLAVRVSRQRALLDQSEGRFPQAVLERHGRMVRQSLLSEHERLVSKLDRLDRELNFRLESELAAQASSLMFEESPFGFTEKLPTFVRLQSLQTELDKLREQILEL